MTDFDRLSRYRRLFAKLGEQRARRMLDRLQVVALTRPDAMRELEAFLDREPTERRDNGDSNA